MRYLILADVVAIVHAAFIAFVVIGLVLIIAGATRGWRWVRDWRFRTAHLLAIAIVLAESLAGIPCPLTVFESRLRELGGAAGYHRDFIAEWVDWLVFYDFPTWAFTLLYFATGAAIAVIFFIAPPRRPDRGRSTRRGWPDA